MSPPSDGSDVVTIVGSGTAVPDPARVCSGYFVRTGALRILLDCGSGVVHHLAKHGLEWQRITHLGLTHFHNDHIGDVPMLFFALRHGMLPGRTEPLTVFGPRGTRALLDGMAQIFGAHVADPGFPVIVHELDAASVLDLGGGVRVAAHPTPHTSASIAYRIETADGTIGYTGDTGYSEEVATFLKDADILIAECSLPDAEEPPAHLTPARLAGMAAHARPRRLVVTHVYPQLARFDIPALLARAHWSGTTVMAFDGLQLPVRA